MWPRAIPRDRSPRVFRDAAGDVTIVWNSRPNRDYAVDVTTDFEIWNELDDGVESEGETTSYTDSPGAAAATTRGYLVREL